MKAFALAAANTPRIPAEAKLRPRRRPNALGGGRGLPRAGNNYLAECRARPRSANRNLNWGRNRKGAGAPRGNKNAYKHGACVVETRARFAGYRARVERIKWTCALVVAMVDAHVDTDSHLGLIKTIAKQGLHRPSATRAKGGAPTEAAPPAHLRPAFADAKLRLHRCTQGFGGHPSLNRRRGVSHPKLRSSEGWWPRTDSNGHVPFGTTDFKFVWAAFYG